MNDRKLRRMGLKNQVMGGAVQVSSLFWSGIIVSTSICLGVVAVTWIWRVCTI